MYYFVDFLLVYRVSFVVDAASTTGFCSTIIKSRTPNQFSLLGKNEKGRLEKKTQKKSKNMAEAPKPNYFVAFKVSDGKIVKNVKRLQKSMMNRPVTSFPNCEAEVFRPTLISASKFHFSLYVMHLDNDDVKRAKEVLRNVYNDVKDQFNTDPLHLPIKGLGTFGKNEVLFAKISDEGKTATARVRNLANAIKEAYEEVGFTADAHPFVPHMTIAKMSKAKNKIDTKFRYIPPELWKEDEDMNFGFQKLEAIELLEMKSSTETDYYKSIARFQFV